jgi:hypothetical protein
MGESHLQQPTEDLRCTSCDGHGKEMFLNGPDACLACDGTGSGYTEWVNTKQEPINWRDDPAAIVEDDGRQDGRDYA